MDMHDVCPCGGAPAVQPAAAAAHDRALSSGSGGRRVQPPVGAPPPRRRNAVPWSLPDRLLRVHKGTHAVPVTRTAVRPATLHARDQRPRRPLALVRVGSAAGRAEQDVLDLVQGQGKPRPLLAFRLQVSLEAGPGARELVVKQDRQVPQEEHCPMVHREVGIVVPERVRQLGGEVQHAHEDERLDGKEEDGPIRHGKAQGIRTDGQTDSDHEIQEVEVLVGNGEIPEVLHLLSQVSVLKEGGHNAREQVQRGLYLLEAGARKVGGRFAEHHDPLRVIEGGEVVSLRACDELQVSQPVPSGSRALPPVVGRQM
mmetsp:Transcript_141814/g.440930  ORF Transcript_141814/g.440930 Transcript_141814/m.440930 type:complete len:313 (+) Transcript_141814:508-1446(+)